MTTLTSIDSSLSDVVTPMNQALRSVQVAGMFGIKSAVGLTLVLYGGVVPVNGTPTANSGGDTTLTLTASTTNYVEANAAGAASFNTSGFTPGSRRLYTVVTTASAMTITDERILMRTGPQQISVATTGGSTTLSQVQIDNDVLTITGVLTSNATLTVPNTTDIKTFRNNTTGAYTVTVKTAAGTGPLLPRGRSVRVYADGTNVLPVNPGEFHQEIAYAASLTFDAALGERLIIQSLTGNLTVNAPSNPYIGQRIYLSFLQDATGSRAITWNAAFKKAADVLGAANLRGTTSFIYDGTNWVQEGGALTWY